MGWGRGKDSSEPVEDDLISRTHSVPAAVKVPDEGSPISAGGDTGWCDDGRDTCSLGSW